MSTWIFSFVGYLFADPRREQHWHWTKPEHDLGSIIRRERFSAISTRITFNEQEILDLLFANTCKIYRPTSVLVTDESMVAFEGSGCPYRMYVPLKPIPNGIQIVDIADSNRILIARSLRDSVSDRIFVISYNVSFIFQKISKIRQIFRVFTKIFVN